MEEQIYVIPTPEYSEASQKFQESETSEKISEQLRKSWVLPIDFFHIGGNIYVNWAGQFRHIIVYKDFEKEGSKKRIYLLVKLLRWDDSLFKKILDSKELIDIDIDWESYYCQTETSAFVLSTPEYNEASERLQESKSSEKIKDLLRDTKIRSINFIFVGKNILVYWASFYHHIIVYKDFEKGGSKKRIYLLVKLLMPNDPQYHKIFETKQLDDIDIDWESYYRQTENTQTHSIKSIGFTVDAGLINRLGIELVGKAETAVSELIKNAYDADATEVKIEFLNTDEKGGTVIITDNGLGMTEEQLINGFMRISSTEKIHNPKSLLFGRRRAGKKGIGRFATQRLGEKLIITTQAKDSNQVTMINIDWNLYQSDTDIESVKFPLTRKLTDIKSSGTKLEIIGLREKWTTSSIEKIFSYVNSLFQPDYLSDRSKINHIAVKNDASFKFSFTKDGVEINNNIKNFYNEALVSIEGYVGDDHKGMVSIDSQQLITDVHEIVGVEYEDKNRGEIITLFPALTNVRFKVYYFIYDKTKYRSISSNTLNYIKNNSDNISGIRLYRNGFRVLPYGEPFDDWLFINQRYALMSGTNIPFSTKHLFGFVEILDDESRGAVFQETSSREGFVEDESFKQLVNFVRTSLIIARRKLQIIIQHLKYQNKTNYTDITITSDKNNKTNRNAIDSLKKDAVSAIENNTIFNKEEKEQKKAEVEVHIKQIKELIKENEMLRVLATMGLHMGEFAHEVRTLQDYINNNVYSLESAIKDDNAMLFLNQLMNNFDELFNYTNYFEVAESQNKDRVKNPVDLNVVVRIFARSISNDIEIKVEQLNFDVITKPMHQSEWSSILSNLFSNSKKAIKRKGCKGKILIQIGIENNNTFLLFNDNGDGIKEEDKDYIFDAFFTTSRPVSYDSPSSEQLIGTGLGLKIIKDIILENNGTISLVEPSQGYTTCFKITIPKYKK